MQQQQPVIVRTNQPGATLQILPNQPTLSSHLLKWDGITVRYAWQPAWETPEHCNTQHLILIRYSHDYVNSERQLDDKRQREQFSQGDTVLIPVNVRHKARWDGAGEIISISLEPTQLAHLAHESVDGDRLELLPQFAHPDLLIHGIGVALKRELEAGEASSRLYVDALTTALGAHLIRRYATRHHYLGNYTDGLPKLKLQLVIDYIQAYLDRDLSVGELAAIVQMSRYHFGRLFKQSTGLTAHQYVLQCRIEKAKQLLRDPELPITEVYQQVGFQSQSHFTKVFRRHTGVTPKAYRTDRK
ncbi:AraC family transcriptional regulator [Brasilonema bromeliae]|uniref:AraC family transcriptional regulator n=1 Tax=Brasilonema bromeliae SPC951 TaxID=385972 RepID=A0ABX1PCN0_9CYAN|nr:AraC family transcriptional regulator [Brasilonema bromeliae]NMG22230.1 AraC family transcriptional regulator [Brasilonema bromeliae SPC951]